MNILTVDLEEWFTYNYYKKGEKSFYEPILEMYLDRLLELFSSNEIKVTFFCLGSIARTHPEIIKKIVSFGHEIGCHSDEHKFITQMTPDDFRIDTKIAIDSLQQVVGEKITMYRAPAFTITEKTSWALDVLIEEGIKYDSSIFPAARSYGGFPSYSGTHPGTIKTNSGEIREFPMSYSNFAGKKIIFSGGGYFRLLPFKVIKNYFEGSDYNMSYFHLRDFDSSQKQIYSMRYFQTYYGIKNSFKKFEKLIDNFKFISLGQAAERIDWNNKEAIKMCKF